MDTLTRIRAFIDVVEAEGFSAAARKVGRSKALLSKYVRELEDDLGRSCSTVPHGNSRSPRPGTPITAPPPTSSRKSTIWPISSARVEGSQGPDRISAPRTFVDAAVGQSLIDFASAHPDVTLEIISDDRFVDLVEEGYDVAIRITRLEDSGLSPATLRFLSHSPARHPSFSRNMARSPILRSLAASPALSTPMAVSEQLAV
jgi:DNA-binding transcriptional LysR family regulator